MKGYRDLLFLLIYRKNVTPTFRIFVGILTILLQIVLLYLLFSIVTKNIKETDKDKPLSILIKRIIGERIWHQVVYYLFVILLLYIIVTFILTPFPNFSQFSQALSPVPSVTNTELSPTSLLELTKTQIPTSTITPTPRLIATSTQTPTHTPTPTSALTPTQTSINYGIKVGVFKLSEECKEDNEELITRHQETIQRLVGLKFNVTEVDALDNSTYMNFDVLYLYEGWWCDHLVFDEPAVKTNINKFLNRKNTGIFIGNPDIPVGVNYVLKVLDFPVTYKLQSAIPSNESSRIDGGATEGLKQALLGNSDAYDSDSYKKIQDKLPVAVLFMSLKDESYSPELFPYNFIAVNRIKWAPSLVASSEDAKERFLLVPAHEYLIEDELLIRFIRWLGHNPLG